ncbi:MAG TPA: EamA family transporter [Streptosporangiaceae bacterium]|nr:EamA family transporter [Streptosporangiaceae bacterium]
MSPTAIALILVAAVAHASWNLFSKQASAAGTVCFLWLFFTMGAILYAPVTAVVLIVAHPRLSGLPTVFLIGTAVIHIGYALLLQNGYRLGDLSVVYPIGRGSGALLAALAGIVLLGERPGPIAVTGIALIVAGVMVIGLPSRNPRPQAQPVQPAHAVQPAQPVQAAPPAQPGRRPPVALGVMFALLTGITIAVYTLWDKYAVGPLHVPPVVEDWAATLGVAVALAPLALRDRPKLVLVWRRYRPQVLGAAILSPLAYILVLSALRFTAVDVVAPSREVSVLFGVLLGRRLLGEGNLARRLVAAAAIVAGIIAVAVS